MTPGTTSPTITPLEVWRAYPGADLLAIDPPEEKETFAEYVDRVGRVKLLDCGDTLFAFIMFECKDGDGNCENVSRMLTAAIRELMLIQLLTERVSVRKGLCLMALTPFLAKLVNNVADAAANLADATAAEMKLEDERVAHKLMAIDRIMSRGDNPLTGKPHSYSSAENIVNTDESYQEYLGQIRAAVRNRIIARGGYEAALIEARLQGVEDV